MKKRLGALLAAAVLAVGAIGVSACGDDESPSFEVKDCINDEYCAPCEEYCDFGQCVPICETDQDCFDSELDFELMCNPLTGVCIASALYTTSCSTGDPCSTEDGGEVLACAVKVGLCVPAPRCDRGCQCSSGFTCDSSTHLCAAEP